VPWVFYWRHRWEAPCFLSSVIATHVYLALYKFFSPVQLGFSVRSSDDNQVVDWITDFFLWEISQCVLT